MKAVIFDLDGVIVDTMDLHFELGAKVLLEHGTKVNIGKMRKLDSTRSTEGFSKFLSSKTPAQIKELVAKKYSYLMSKTKGIKPIPGFLDFFFLVKDKYKLGLVSSSNLAFVEHILNELGIKGNFSVIVGGDSVEKGKPDPEGFLKAAKNLKVDPKDCFVIEDSINGIIAAKRAGMKCIAVTNTYNKNFLLDADLIVDSLGELNLQMLEALNAT